MSTLVVILLLGLAGGVAVGLQSPLASIIGQRIGSMESVFIIHLGGAITASVFLFAQRGGQLAQWRSVPWYALAAGALGLVVVSAANYVIPRQGVVTMVFLIVTGQLVISMLIDHFGILGAEQRPMDPTRLVGVAVLFLGVWLIVRSG